MTARIINWQPGTAPLGSAVVAIGVFDGVHIGHQALLRETVADAAARGAHSVAVTFDRDPDQIVSPQTAAPQLLTLDDKLAAMSRTGVDAILVVPFTAQLAELTPEAFLDSVLLAALAPVAVHVGRDFRFGKMAAGDVSALQRTGASRGFDVTPHDLVTADGATVTSTRIRGLVASGQIAEATTLLGGHPCVAGTVHRGRGEGAGLGFPTANVVPVKFAALPGDGVYAGRAILADGSAWAAAISVGTPPMFPQAKDYLEAHVVGFDGDLYDRPITLEFWDRLRDQQSYPSLDDLKTAIADDVDRALDIAGFTGEQLLESAETPGDLDELADRSDAVADYDTDPAALEAAEQAAMRAPSGFSRMATGEWVPVITERSFEILAAGAQAYTLVAPLEAAKIPYAWDPYPPEEGPAALRGAMTRPFSVLVPAELLGEAQAALGDEADPVQEHSPGPAATRSDDSWALLLGDLPFDKQRLLAIDGALESAGIEHVWEPYPPEERPLLNLNLFGMERFSVSVSSVDVEAAKALLGGLSHGEKDR